MLEKYIGDRAFIRRVLAVALPVFGVLFAVVAWILKIGRKEDDV